MTTNFVSVEVDQRSELAESKQRLQIALCSSPGQHVWHPPASGSLRLFMTIRPSSGLLNRNGASQQTQLTWANINLFSPFSSNISNANVTYYQNKISSISVTTDCSQHPPLSSVLLPLFPLLTFTDKVVTINQFSTPTTTHMQSSVFPLSLFSRTLNSSLQLSYYLSFRPYPLPYSISFFSNTRSYPVSYTYPMPQGSVLGPLFFLTYTNSMGLIIGIWFLVYIICCICHKTVDLCNSHICPLTRKTRDLQCAGHSITTFPKTLWTLLFYILKIFFFWPLMILRVSSPKN